MRQGIITTFLELKNSRAISSGSIFKDRCLRRAGERWEVARFALQSPPYFCSWWQEFPLDMCVYVKLKTEELTGSLWRTFVSPDPYPRHLSSPHSGRRGKMYSLERTQSLSWRTLGIGWQGLCTENGYLQSTFTHWILNPTVLFLLSCENNDSQVSTLQATGQKILLWSFQSTPEKNLSDATSGASQWNNSATEAHGWQAPFVCTELSVIFLVPQS